MNECKHKKIRRNYPFGRKSNAFMYCEICGIVIKGKHLQEIRNKKEKVEKRRR